jgi:hypothetical protein
MPLNFRRPFLLRNEPAPEAHPVHTNFGYITSVPSTVEPFSTRRGYRILHSMAAESTKRKDSLRVEKLSLFILTLCVVVLVYVLVAKPF